MRSRRKLRKSFRSSHHAATVQLFPQRIPIAYIDTHAAEKLFRHNILHFLQRRGLLSDERIELWNSFRNSGFSVDTSPTVWPRDSEGLERLGRYMLRCPLSLSRIHWTQGAPTLFYQSKASNDDPQLSLFHHPDGESLDVFEFIARVLTQIPVPRKHNIHYFWGLCLEIPCSEKKARSAIGTDFGKS